MKNKKGRLGERLALNWINRKFPTLRLFGANLNFGKFGELDLVFWEGSMCNDFLDTNKGKPGTVSDFGVKDVDKSISRETKQSFYVFEVRSQYCDCLKPVPRNLDISVTNNWTGIDQVDSSRSNSNGSIDSENNLNSNKKAINKDKTKTADMSSVGTLKFPKLVQKESVQGNFTDCFRCGHINPMGFSKKFKLLKCVNLLRLHLVCPDLCGSDLTSIPKKAIFGSRETNDIEIFTFLLYLKINLNGNYMTKDVKNPKGVLDKNHGSEKQNIYYKVELFKLGVTP